MKQKLASCLAVLLIAAALFPAHAALANVPAGYTSKVDYDNTDPSRYSIDIDINNQIITVYDTLTGGIVLQGLCTTGNEENPTGSGTFKLGHLKERFGYFVAYGQYAQYWTQVVRGVYIHTVMYDKKSLTTMSKSAYNGLGKALSHGCVRVMPEHAKWIFYNCPPGTTCVISKSRALNPTLVSALKAAKPSYSSYVQPVDFKADPPIVPAYVRVDNVPVRTGFSSTKDSTVETLSASAVVQVLQLGPDWCKVETKKGKLGYVQTKYLQLNPDQTVSRHGAYYAKETTYLYKSASTNAQKLHTFEKGAPIEVIGSADIYWLTARVGGTYGFVRVKHTVTEKPGVTTPDIPPFEPHEAVIKRGIIANVRSGPGTDYPVVMELPAGTSVLLVEDLGNWYYIQAGGQGGYVSRTCIG